MKIEGNKAMDMYLRVTDENYFRDVLGSLFHHGKQSKVQFGETGVGVSPHYQICDAEGGFHLYDGKSHKLYKGTDVEVFAPENLTPPLSLEEVQMQISRCRTYD